MKPHWGAARWGAFNLVGGIGIAVQVALLWLLGEVGGLGYFGATILAVEGTILHNFFWHERWTWAERTRRDQSGWIVRLARFNLTSGLISVTVNLAVMTILVGGLRLTTSRPT